MANITNISTHSIGSLLHEYFAGCKESVYIMSPFIELSALEKVLGGVETSQVSIVTTWKQSDLRAGVSTLDLYPLCKKNGWTLYINNHLHAKLYTISFSDCYLGSMNCTNKALFNPQGNIECYSYKNKMDVGNRIELNKIISTAILVDDRVYQQYLDWFDNLDKTQLAIEEFELKDPSPFYVFQLPTIAHPLDLWDYLQRPRNYSYEESEYYEHDLAIYTSGLLSYSDKDTFVEDLKRNFLAHPFIKRIDAEISSEGMRFGEYKELIREICADVPLPYAKDLTVFVQNLYGWFTELFPDLYYIDIPGRHSQCLHRYMDKTDEHLDSRY